MSPASHGRECCAEPRSCERRSISLPKLPSVIWQDAKLHAEVHELKQLDALHRGKPLHAPETGHQVQGSLNVVARRHAKPLLQEHETAIKAMGHSMLAHSIMTSCC
eukprot:10303340-Alexandrium_andersonii.AAC.1